MASRVIIHIGLPKTGTTSLQRAFTKSSGLLRRYGIAYPLPGGGQHYGQHTLGRSVAGGRGIDACWAALEPQVDGCHTILLSTESLSGASEPNIRAFEELLSARLGSPDFTIYVGLRRWSDRLVSFWHQRVRTGGGGSLPEFVQEQCGKSPVGHLLEIAPAIERWAAVFGRPAMKVAPMERLTGGGRDLVVETFRDLLGIEANFSKGLYHANQSLAPETEVIRAVNRCHHDTRTAFSVARATLRRFKMKKQTAVECAALLESRMTDLTLDDRHPLFVALEAETLARCGDLITRGPDGGIFSIRAPRTWRYVPDEALLEPEIRSRIERLHAKVVRWVHLGKDRPARGGLSWLSNLLSLRKAV